MILKFPVCSCPCALEALTESNKISKVLKGQEERIGCTWLHMTSVFVLSAVGQREKQRGVLEPVTYFLFFLVGGYTDTPDFRRNPCSVAVSGFHSDHCKPLV